MGFVHYSEGFLFSNCHSPIALYLIRLTNMRTRLSVLGTRRIKSELFIKGVYIAKQTRWNHSCSENVIVVCKTFFASRSSLKALSEQPVRKSMDLLPSWWQGAMKRDSDFTFFTPRSREAVPELGWGPFFKGPLHLHVTPCAGCNPTTLIPNVYQDLLLLLRGRGYCR